MRVFRSELRSRVDLNIDAFGDERKERSNTSTSMLIEVMLEKSQVRWRAYIQVKAWAEVLDQSEAPMTKKNHLAPSHCSSESVLRTTSCLKFDETAAYGVFLHAFGL
jgi:hypothetical protein